MKQTTAFKLSICIATYNRAELLGRTIESIITQTPDDFEIVVSDNASTDDTQHVVSDYSRRFDRLRYLRQVDNKGFDRNFDSAVEFARGEYCWLVPDDDWLLPDAIATVLNALRRDLSLVVVNVEYRDFTMSKVVQPRGFHFESDRLYRTGEMERLFLETGVVLKYVGSVVIKRAIWLERQRQQYYGSWFIWLGVIFQEHLPGEALAIAKPLISYRKGNTHTYSPLYSEIWFSKLPQVVGSFKTVSESAKAQFWKRAEQWSNFPELLRWRAFGLYSMNEYRRWIRPRLGSMHARLAPRLIALLPGALVNALFVIYYSVTRRPRGVWRPEMELESLRESPFHYTNWRFFKRSP